MSNDGRRYRSNFNFRLARPKHWSLSDYEPTVDKHEDDDEEEKKQGMTRI
jgi:hypothetical protein